MNINGMLWWAGDNVYVDVYEGAGVWNVVCLNDYLKTHIHENSRVKITIEVENK